MICVLSAHAEDALISNDRYEKEVVVSNLSDPLQLDLTPEGRIFLIERAGAVKTWDPGTGLTTTLLQLKTTVEADAGALALALHPDFSRNRQLFVYYTTPGELGVMRLARYTWEGDALVDEKRILDVPLEPGTPPYHCGGGLAWDREGNLLLSTGDNSAPQDVPAVHPVDSKRDSRRSAGNSMDLRGKILRFTPKPDGSYTCPPGNLFADPARGRPEIYAMGVRNPFRVSTDPDTGLISWGDVGGNVNEKLGLGPEGNDEINVTRVPGFFGWPWLSGVTGYWRSFEPSNMQPSGEFFQPDHIINDSPANTGLKELPPALPPILYYSNMPSTEWPFTGSGGRSVTGGVFYRTSSRDERRLPDSLRGTLIFGEWMRNWLAVATITPEGKLISAGRFLANLEFRRPADFKIGPEGALYIAESGEKWTGNNNSQITRVIYRRGNKPPGISLVADTTAGRVPLTVKLTAQVSDADQPGAALPVTWEMPPGITVPDGPSGTVVFPSAGAMVVRATVTDAAGAAKSASLTIYAGNEAPVVRFVSPRDGGFFEYGQPIVWKVETTDGEDGTLPAENLRVEMARYDASPLGTGSATSPGLALMRQTTCFACHQANIKSAGPAYVEVARRYAPDPAAPALLAQKILSGSNGVWGEIPMPPHPQHTAAEAAQMVNWILSLASMESSTLTGISGTSEVPAPGEQWGRPHNGVVLFTATATDNGAGSLPALASPASTVQLRTRRQRAYFFDDGAQAIRQDNLDQGGMVARIAAGGYITFRHIALAGCGGISLEAWPQGSSPLKIEIRRANGSILSSMESISPRPGKGKADQLQFLFSDLNSGSICEDISIHLISPAGGLLDVLYVDFLPAK